MLIKSRNFRGLKAHVPAQRPPWHIGTLPEAGKGGAIQFEFGTTVHVLLILGERC